MGLQHWWTRDEQLTDYLDLGYTGSYVFQVSFYSQYVFWDNLKIKNYFFLVRIKGSCSIENNCKLTQLENKVFMVAWPQSNTLSLARRYSHAWSISIWRKITRQYTSKKSPSQTFISDHEWIMSLYYLNQYQDCWFAYIAQLLIENFCGWITSKLFIRSVTFI